MRPDKLPSPLFAALLVGLASWVSLGLSAIGLLDDQSIFVALTLLLLGYLGLEVARLRQLHPDRWLLNPVALCSLMTFLLGYGVTNFIYFAPASQMELLALVPEVSPTMVRVMGLALLGAVAMWLGYWSPVAAHWSGPDKVDRFRERFLPGSQILRSGTLPALLGVAITARLIQIKLGVFGYSSTYDRLIELGSITQYLSMASSLGSMAVVLGSLQFYGQRASVRNRIWLVGILASEFFFGLLSGFKSALVMPFLVAAICQYLRLGRISKYWPLLAAAGILVGYTVIEPFRDARNRDLGFTGTSIVEIVSVMVSSTGVAAESVVETAPIVLAVAGRLNYSYIAAFGIDFADANPVLPDGSPAFLQDIVRAPLHAWVPRLLWESKPLGNLGLWYNQVVMEKDHFSSTAMGPFAYLYFAGGSLAVFLGFLFVGMVQRCLYFLLQPRMSTAGAVIFLAMLSSIMQIDSAFNGLIITLCRDFPLVIMLQFLIFKPRASGCAIDGRVSDDPALGLMPRAPAEAAMPLVTGRFT
jgi:hypothetical protein